MDDDQAFGGYVETTVHAGPWLLASTAIFCFTVMLVVVPLAVAYTLRRRRYLQGSKPTEHLVDDDKENINLSLRNIFGSTKETYKILKLAVPYTIGTLSSSIFSNLCLIMISKRIGTKAVAAYALVVILVGLTNGVLLGPTTACTTLCSHAVGSGNNFLAGQYIQLAITFYTLASLPVVLFWTFAMQRTILILEWGDLETAMDSHSFVQLYVWSVVVQGISNSIWQLLEVTGHAFVGTIISIIWGASNVFIIGRIVTTQEATLMDVGLVYLCTALFFVGLTIILAVGFGWFRPFWSGFFGKVALCNTTAVAQMLRQGGPLSIGSLLMDAEWTLLTFFASHLGPAEVAAWALLGSIWDIFYSVTEAIGDAAEIRVAYHLGNNHPTLARLSSYKSLVLGMVVAFVTSLFFFSVQSYVPAWFTTDEALQAILAEVVPFIGLANLAMTFGMQCWALVGAQGKYRFATIVSLVSSWGLSLPLAAISVYVIRWDLQGLTAAIIVGYIATGAALSYVLLSTDWYKVAKKIHLENKFNDPSDPMKGDEEDNMFADLRTTKGVLVNKRGKHHLHSNIRMLIIPAGTRPGLVVGSLYARPGTFIVAVHHWSPLHEQAKIGDSILALNGVDVSNENPEILADLLKLPSIFDRQIVLAHCPIDEEDPEGVECAAAYATTSIDPDVDVEYGASSTNPRHPAESYFSSFREPLSFACVLPAGTGTFENVSQFVTRGLNLQHSSAPNVDGWPCSVFGISCLQKDHNECEAKAPSTVEGEYVKLSDETGVSPLATLNVAQISLDNSYEKTSENQMSKTIIARAEGQSYVDFKETSKRSLDTLAENEEVSDRNNHSALPMHNPLLPQVYENNLTGLGCMDVFATPGTESDAEVADMLVTTDYAQGQATTFQPQTRIEKDEIIMENSSFIAMNTDIVGLQNNCIESEQSPVDDQFISTTLNEAPTSAPAMSDKLILGEQSDQVDRDEEFPEITKEDESVDVLTGSSHMINASANSMISPLFEVFASKRMDDALQTHFWQEKRDEIVHPDTSQTNLLLPAIPALGYQNGELTVGMNDDHRREIVCSKDEVSGDEYDKLTENECLEKTETRLDSTTSAEGQNTELSIKLIPESLLPTADCNQAGPALTLESTEEAAGLAEGLDSARSMRERIASDLAEFVLHKTASTVEIETHTIHGNESAPSKETESTASEGIESPPSKETDSAPSEGNESAPSDGMKCVFSDLVRDTLSGMNARIAHCTDQSVSHDTLAIPVDASDDLTNTPTREGNRDNDNNVELSRDFFTASVQETRVKTFDEPPCETAVDHEIISNPPVSAETDAVGQPESTLTGIRNLVPTTVSFEQKDKCLESSDERRIYQEWALIKESDHVLLDADLLGLKTQEDTLEGSEISKREVEQPLANHGLDNEFRLIELNRQSDVDAPAVVTGDQSSSFCPFIVPVIANTDLTSPAVFNEAGDNSRVELSQYPDTASGQDNSATHAMTPHPSTCQTAMDSEVIEVINTANDVDPTASNLTIADHVSATIPCNLLNDCFEPIKEHNKRQEVALNEESAPALPHCGLMNSDPNENTEAASWGGAEQARCSHGEEMSTQAELCVQSGVAEDIIPFIGTANQTIFYGTISTPVVANKELSSTAMLEYIPDKDSRVELSHDACAAPEQEDLATRTLTFEPSPVQASLDSKVITNPPVAEEVDEVDGADQPKLTLIPADHATTTVPFDLKEDCLKSSEGSSIRQESAFSEESTPISPLIDVATTVYEEKRISSSCINHVGDEKGQRIDGEKNASTHDVPTVQSGVVQDIFPTVIKADDQNEPCGTLSLPFVANHDVTNTAMFKDVSDNDSRVELSLETYSASAQETHGTKFDVPTCQTAADDEGISNSPVAEGTDMGDHPEPMLTIITEHVPTTESFERKDDFLE